MYLGEIVEIGTRANIFANPQHPYTKKLLAAVPVADPARRGSRRNILDEGIRSPVRPVDYIPPVREHRQVYRQHTVQVWGEEWGGT